MRYLVIAVAVVALTAGCAGAPDGSSEADAGARADGPDAMLKQVLAYHFRGAYRLAYDSLHPRHQALVTRENYAYCLKQVLATLNLTAVKTVEIADRPLARPGIPETRAKAVTLRITVVSGKLRDSWEQTFRAVRVDGRWTWILPDRDAGEYRAGRCPAA